MQRDGHEQPHPHDGETADESHTQKNAVFTTLVVETQANFAEFLEDFLTLEGHFIIRADSAEQALALTQQHWPDLILLNGEMPGSHGLKFLPELLMAHPSAAVVMMATEPSISDAVDAIKLGATDYMRRPLDKVRLKKTMDEQRTLFGLL